MWALMVDAEAILSKLAEDEAMLRSIPKTINRTLTPRTLPSVLSQTNLALDRIWANNSSLKVDRWPHHTHILHIKRLEAPLLPIRSRFILSLDKWLLCLVLECSTHLMVDIPNQWAFLK